MQENRTNKEFNNHKKKITEMPWYNMPLIFYQYLWWKQELSGFLKG
jgi:hypothetical protein